MRPRAASLFFCGGTNVVEVVRSGQPHRPTGMYRTTKGGECMKKPVTTLADQVRKADPSTIALPILRELVTDVKEKQVDQLRQGNQLWKDSQFRQWRQHSSHNPW